MDSEKIEIGENERNSTRNRRCPEEKAFSFQHPQINEKEPEPVEGMEEEQGEKESIEGPAFMKAREPRGRTHFSDQGITREDFQSHEDKENRSAESNEVVREHRKNSIINNQWAISNYQWSMLNDQ